ncbi:MAG: C40 family peptidase [Deltaproteobacteria bacterium]|nr:C40 family peptidase [Deltaproteobacteria bacterium]
MRALVFLACSAVALLGCDHRRGYATYPQGSPQGAGPWSAGPYGGWPPPQGWPPPEWGQAPDPRVSQVPGWGQPGARGPIPPGPSQRGAHAAHAAMSLQGRPYCWGGTGPDCFDCSGLTYTAWRAAGVTIPRTSDLQHEKLRAVGLHELFPGDILWRPGHVGLYVGNGWAIHAPGTGKVVQYQAASKFVGAHRPE